MTAFLQYRNLTIYLSVSFSSKTLVNWANRESYREYLTSCHKTQHVAINAGNSCYCSLKRQKIMLSKGDLEE